MAISEAVLVARDDALTHIRRRKAKPPAEPDQTLSAGHDSILIRWGYLSCCESNAVASYIRGLAESLGKRGLSDRFFCIAVRTDGTLQTFGEDTDNAFHLRVVQDFMYDDHA